MLPEEEREMLSSNVDLASQAAQALFEFVKEKLIEEQMEIADKLNELDSLTKSDQVVQKMEDRRFGVKLSLLNQLRRFQLSLRLKRDNMPFNKVIIVSCNNGPSRNRQVIARERRISIVPWNPPMHAVLLPRQDPQIIGNNGVSLQLDDMLVITLSFENENDKQEFLNALGDLNVSSSEEDSSEIEPVANGV